jgi:hypothetical protein
MHANIQQALWMSHPVLELSLAGILYWRRLHRTFPLFFAYIVFQVVNFLILFPIYRYDSARTYFYAYWVCGIISLAIGFKVIHEIFLDVLSPYPNLKDLGTLLFKWAGLVMLLVAIVVTAASQSDGQDTVLGQAVIIGQRCVRFIQCGLIFFLLFFSRHLGISKRQFSFGIALGFGSFAIVELVGIALISGGVHNAPVSLINTAAYSLSILAWIGYALLKTPSREGSAKLLMSQRWDYGLNELRHPVAGDSLIPMFESMVDRAFSRTPTETESAEIEDKRVVRKTSVSEKATPFSRRALPSDLVR